MDKVKNFFKRLLSGDLFKTKSLKVSAIFNAIYQVLIVVIPLIITPYIARVLGPGPQGTYAYYLSIASYFTMFATFGITDYGTKTIAQVRDDPEAQSKAFWEITFAKLITTAIALVAYFPITLSIFQNSSSIQLFCILSITVISVGLDSTFFFQGREEFIYICLRNFLVKILTLIAIFVFVKTADDLWIYTLIMSLSTLLSALIICVSLHGKITSPFKIKLNIWPHFKGALPYFITGLGTTLFFSLNSTLLGAITNSDVENGYYDQAYKIINVISSFVGSINIIVLSRISYLYAIHDSEEINRKLSKVFACLWSIALPCCFGLAAVNQYLLPVFLGSGYDKSITLLYIMIPCILFGPLNTILGSIYYRPLNKTWLQAGIVLFAGAVSVVSNYLLTPSLLSIGTAISLLIAQALQTPLLLYYSNDFIKTKSVFSEMIKPLDASLIMFVITYFSGRFLSNRGIGNAWIFIVQVALGVLSYWALANLFKIDFLVDLQKSAFEKVKKIFSKKSNQKDSV